MAPAFPHTRPRRALAVILFAVFLDLVSYGILVPVVPQLLANPGSPYFVLSAAVPISHGYILLGFLIAAFPIFQFFSAPILGELSDGFGRRRVLSLTLAATGISFALFAGGIVWKSLGLLFASRIIAGLMGGSISVAQAAVADITPPSRRAANFGLIGAAYGIGFILGPVIGAVLSDPHVVSWFDAATPFWVATALSFISALSVWIFLGETRVATGELVLTWTKSLSHIVRAYALKPLRGVFAASFMFQSSIALFSTFFTVFLIDSFGFGQMAVGYYLGYAGVWIIVAQGFVLRVLSRRFDEVTLLRFFMCAGSLAIFAYYVPSTLWGLLVVGAIFALTNGISMAAIPSLVSRRAAPAIHGEALGINASVQALAQIAPPILAGFLAAELDPAAPVYLSGAIMALGWAVLMAFVRRRSSEARE